MPLLESLGYSAALEQFRLENIPGDHEIAICHASGVNPVILLNKTDLADCTQTEETGCAVLRSDDRLVLH